MTLIPYMIDPTGKLRGRIRHSSITVNPLFNDVGTWSLTAQLTAKNAQAAAEGWRIWIPDSDGQVYGGPVTAASIKAGSDDSSRATFTVTLSGEDDMRSLRGRNAWPTPANAPSAQTTAYDTRTGQGSAILRQYVDNNAGPSARTERRVPGLSIGTDPAVGSTVTGNARFDVLLELLQNLAISAGGLGFRVAQISRTEREFQVYQPRDLRGPARFSMQLGNLRSLSWSLTAPTATTIIGGGQGDLTDRAFISVSNSTDETAWGRVEGFYDYGSAPTADDNAALLEGAQQQLDQAISTRQVEAVPIDTPNLAWGRNWGLGDHITVDIYGGITMDGVVRGATITEQRGSSGPLRTVKPLIGDLGATATTRQWQLLARALADIRRIQTR